MKDGKPLVAGHAPIQVYTRLNSPSPCCAQKATILKIVSEIPLRTLEACVGLSASALGQGRLYAKYRFFTTPLRFRKPLETSRPSRATPQGSVRSNSRERRLKLRTSMSSGGMQSCRYHTHIRILVDSPAAKSLMLGTGHT